MNRQESVKAFQDVFDAFDLDRNGTIDIKELELGLSKQKGGELSASALQELLDKFDANKNGVLERDEFTELMNSAELDEFFAQEQVGANEQAGPSLDLDAVYKLTPTPEETPTFRKEKLAEFERVLGKIDHKKKSACAMAQEQAPDLTGDDFKLAFLRTDVFQVELAVTRWIKYWDFRLEKLGEDKAFLPMTPEGAMKGREKALSSCYARFADGVTDPDGRAIGLFDFREEGGDLSDDDLFMALYYNLHVMLSSESAQKRGIVWFFKCLDRYSDGRVSVWKMFKDARVEGTFPVRVSAMHIVKPPIFIKILVKIMKIMMGPKVRNRIYVHSGSMDKILKSLSKFGLGSKDTLPDVFGGDLSFSPPAKLTFVC